MILKLLKRAGITANYSPFKYFLDISTIIIKNITFVSGNCPAKFKLLSDLSIIADMKKQEYKKKTWTKPSINALSIKKDTFGGNGTGAEEAGKKGPPTKS